MPTPDFVVEAELAAGVWTDISADVHLGSGLTWERVMGSGPLDQVQRPGSFEFVMKNAAHNSGGVAGYYTPGHANVRSGWDHGTRVRLYIDAGGGATWYPFRGRLRSIVPDAGSSGPARVACSAECLMGEFASLTRFDLALEENVRADEGISTLVALLPDAPANEDLDVAIDTLPFLWDDVGGTPPGAITLLQRLVQTERGFLYVRGDATDGETLRFENRHARALKANDATFAENELVGITVPNRLERIYNDVEVATYRRRSDTAATTVLVQLDGPVEVAPNGETATLFVDYRDPAEQAEWIGAKDTQAPDSTDWSANSAEDGTGSDLTASCTVTRTELGSRVKLVLTNNSTSTAYFRGASGADGLRVRGRGIYRYSPVVTRSEASAANLSQYGRRGLSMEMPYQPDANVGQSSADFVRTLWSGLTAIPTAVKVRAGHLATLQKAIVLDIGDRITVTEAMTGVTSAELFVNGVRGVIRPDRGVELEFATAPADTTAVVIFDDPTAGRFDFNSFGW